MRSDDGAVVTEQAAITRTALSTDKDRIISHLLWVMAQSNIRNTPVASLPHRASPVHETIAGPMVVAAPRRGVRGAGQRRQAALGDVPPRARQHDRQLRLLWCRRGEESHVHRRRR